MDSDSATAHISSCLGVAEHLCARGANEVSQPEGSRILSMMAADQIKTAKKNIWPSTKTKKPHCQANEEKKKS